MDDHYEPLAFYVSQLFEGEDILLWEGVLQPGIFGVLNEDINYHNITMRSDLPIRINVFHNAFSIGSAIITPEQFTDLKKISATLFPNHRGEVILSYTGKKAVHVMLKIEPAPTTETETITTTSQFNGYLGIFDKL